jgi:serine phosphatase RsbU (regulator of sigma subunit)
LIKNYSHIVSVCLLFFTFISFQLKAENIEKLLAELNNAEQSNNITYQIEILNKLGFAYWDNQNLDESLIYFQQSLSLNINTNNINAQQHLYSNIGMIYTDKNEHETALLHYRKSLQLKREYAEKRSVVFELLNIATSLSNLERYFDAISVIEEALEESKKLNDITLIRRCYGILSENYDKVGNTQKSLEYYNIFSTLDRHIQKKTIETAKDEATKMKTIADNAIAEQKETQSELIQKKERLQQTESKLKQIQLLNQLQSAKIELQQTALREQEMKIRHKNALIKFQVVISISILLILVLLYKNFITKKRINVKLIHKNEEILKQKELIDKKNADIAGSLHYAKTIQDAIMLPAKEKLKSYIDDSFIFYKPRNIVSGDFYWVEQIKDKSLIFSKSRSNHNTKVSDNDEIILVSADCTGHGVPGAIMSMIGTSLLEEIVSHNIHLPNKILDALHLGVKNTLRQDITDNRDGMDVAVCKINKEEKIVEYSGAMSPLIYIQNGELSEITADIFPIGMDEFEPRRTPYVTRKIEVKQPTMFYLFSDGFQDQIGGKNNEKFLVERFKKLLFKIHLLPMEEQYLCLKNTLSEWMTTEDSQVDDILVIGFKIG